MYIGFDNPPNEERYILVRLKGLHPSLGVPFIPVVLMMSNGQFYSTENELEPFEFGTFDDVADEYIKVGTRRKDLLEWCRLPD